MSNLTKVEQADHEFDIHLLYSRFAKNVQYIRSELGLSQTLFGEMLGVTRSKIGSIEEGRVLGVENIVMLAKIARVSIDTILLTDMRKVKKPISEFMLQTT
jgi:transcriptional regulator with XRE-family HTH domain